MNDQPAATGIIVTLAAVAAFWFALRSRPGIRGLAFAYGVVYVFSSNHWIFWVAATLIFGPAAIDEITGPVLSATKPNPAGARRRQPQPRQTTGYRPVTVETGQRVPRSQRDPIRTAPQSMRDFVLRRDNHRCCFCGAGGEQIRLHIDHVIPWANGGRTHPSNLQTLCSGCNLTKSAHGDADMRIAYYMRTGFAPLQRRLTRR